MKNKKLNYVLVPLVILIWGTIVFKVINHLRDNDTIINPPDIPRLNADRVDSLESYELLANYRDPFIKTQIVRKEETIPENNGRKNSRKSQGRKSAKELVHWPEIIFGGVISNDNNQVGLLKINSNSVLIKVGEIQDGINLISLYVDSVTLTYMGETKTFKKKL